MRPSPVGPVLPLGATGAWAWWTTRGDGDQRALRFGASPPAPVPQGLVVFRLHQVHGADVVVAGPPPAGDLARGPSRDRRSAGRRGAPSRRGTGAAVVLPVAADDAAAGGPPADGVVSRAGGWCLTVLTADCASMALATAGGAYGAVHVGWRGLRAGIVESAVAAIADIAAPAPPGDHPDAAHQGAGAPDGAGPVVSNGGVFAPGGDAPDVGELTRVVAGLGPCIGSCCYEFTGPELEELAARYGDGVVATSRGGRPALDLRYAVRRAVEDAGATVVFEAGPCTACGGGWFSHRARRDVGRQALFVWRQDVPGPERRVPAGEQAVPGGPLPAARDAGAGPDAP